MTKVSVPMPKLGWVVGVPAAAAAAVVIGGLWIMPNSADATPAYASQTGLACGRCHVNPAGGGPRTAFGKAFAANGHKLPGKGGAKQKKSEAGSTTVVTTETQVIAPANCSFYSRVCNPRYGYEPVYGYSNSLMFMKFPQSD